MRGCAPKDIDPSHETGRVRSAPATGADDGQSPCDSHRWFLCPPLEACCLRRLVPFLSFLSLHTACHAVRAALGALGQKTDELASIRGVTLPVDGEKISGAQLYDAHCSTCHQPQGQGSFEGGLPSLLHNTAVGRSNPNNLVMVILDGVKRGAYGEDIRMQDFARNLSDQQVATLATYLTGHYGNADVKVSAAQVKVLRDGGPVSHLGALAQGAIALGVIVVILLVI